MKEPAVERLVAENAQKALCLRLRSMTSATICSRLLSAKRPSLPPETLQRKAEGLASALRSALGFWESDSAALNAKILAQYYFALQLSIAAQVADGNPDSNLDEVQKHTEQGHGLGTLQSPDESFPDNYHVAALKSGHFAAYCNSIGVNLDPFGFGARPRSWSKLTEDDKQKLVRMLDLLRRVPELRSSIFESLGVPPLSFHVAHSFKNMSERAERAQRRQQETGQFVPPNWGPDPGEGPTTTTYVTIATGFGGGEGVTPEFLGSLDLPINDIVWEKDGAAADEQLIGQYRHASNEHWWQSLPLYHASTGTSLIVPLWGTSDPFIIHFVLLYALSIVVRYLPSFWFQIEHGSLDHVRALLEQYATTVDVVLPKLGFERITGRRLQLIYPGSLNAPI
jgi:hypothetical protein